jgi:hypothetical protein
MSALVWGSISGARVGLGSGVQPNELQLLLVRVVNCQAYYTSLSLLNAVNMQPCHIHALPTLGEQAGLDPCCSRCKCLLAQHTRLGNSSWHRGSRFVPTFLACMEEVFSSDPRASTAKEPVPSIS